MRVELRLPRVVIHSWELISPGAEQMNSVEGPVHNGHQLSFTTRSKTRPRHAGEGQISRDGLERRFGPTRPGVGTRERLLSRLDLMSGVKLHGEEPEGAPRCRVRRCPIQPGRAPRKQGVHQRRANTGRRR